ncbi:MAG: beta-galactosidase [Bacteroidales bacterium]
MKRATNLPVLVFILILTAISNVNFGQEREVINIDLPVKEIRSGHLELGGENTKGRVIGVNSYFISDQDVPSLPVTGEFHFSRYPEKYWEEAIQKMRAGGISIIATYVFWNIHEENEGIFNWEGNLNLRNFVELCKAYDYDVIVRIGPFCHGEIRSGGLPDWLMGKPLVIRSNDLLYLSYTERLYQQIGMQLEGLFFKDGGPVIGIQLENEYQHSAAPWGLTYPGQPSDWTVSERDLEVTQAGVGVAEGENPFAGLGNEHMKVLKTLAIKAGLIAPIYTATGWGNAAVIENESLPVTAAYPYPTWAPEQPSDFYLYTDLQKDPDYAPVRYNAEDYPYFAAEIGGGIMNTYTRRLNIPARSLDPLINRFLGSGANGIGYYMYHGGSTPRGDRVYFSDVAIGCPIISYDFQAPIGEFGEIRSSFHRLKLLHYFLNSFGSELAPMQVILPVNQATLHPSDLNSLRYTIRASRDKGFIFMNNFQDHLQMEMKKDIQFTIKRHGGEVLIPERGGISLEKDESAILPFGLNMDGLLLNYATAQLLTKGGDEQHAYYLFFAPPGMEAEYSLKNSDGIEIISGRGLKISKNHDRFLIQAESTIPSEIIITKKDGSTIRILTIDKDLAMKSNIVRAKGKQYIIFTEGVMLDQQGSFNLHIMKNNRSDLAIYPRVGLVPESSTAKISPVKQKGAIMDMYEIEIPSYSVVPEIKNIQKNKILVSLPDDLPSGLNDLFLQIDYTGDTGMGFLRGELVTDHFYYGEKWSVGLKRFLDLPGEKEMVFYFRPLYKDAPFLEDLKSSGIQISDKIEKGFELNGIEMVPEYSVPFKF